MTGRFSFWHLFLWAHSPVVAYGPTVVFSALGFLSYQSPKSSLVLD